MTKWPSTLLAVWLSAVFVAAAPGSSTSWWSPGQGTPLPEFATYDNDQGALGVLNTSGPLDTKVRGRGRQPEPLYLGAGNSVELSGGGRSPHVILPVRVHGKDIVVLQAVAAADVCARPFGEPREAVFAADPQVLFPVLEYARRTWTCDLRTRPPVEHYK